MTHKAGFPTLRRKKRVFITRENRVYRCRLWPGGGAILTFTRHLAQELGPYGINVNAVAPGVVLSGPRLQKMWDERMSQEQKQQYQDRVPLRRLPAVEEITGPSHLKASSYPLSVSSPCLIREKRGHARSVLTEPIH